MNDTQKNIQSIVREQYASTARSDLSNHNEGVRAVAEAFGYTAEQLSAIPAEANMGLSCGNPTAFASLKPGEVVVDLGCGGGLDVFLAAQKLGPTGKAIGIDMTPEMIERARKGAQRGGADGKPITNVEFHLASIDKLPLADASVDVVISNCVINLAPDKQAVFREISRVLKPGGRAAVSDIALKQPLPPELAEDVMAYVGCIAGAVPIDDYKDGLRKAGLAHVQVIDSAADLNAYAKVEGQSGCCTPRAAKAKALPVGASTVACCSPSPAGSAACCTPAQATGAEAAEPQSGVHDQLTDLLNRYDVNDYAASVKVYAVKPKA